MEVRTLVPLRPSSAAPSLATKGRRNLQGATQEDRAVKRQRVFGAFRLEAATGSRSILEEASVKPRTRMRYQKSLEKF